MMSAPSRSASSTPVGERAGASPRLRVCRTTWSTPSARATSTVRSVDPSSMTRTSISSIPGICRGIEASTSGSVSSSLRQGSARRASRAPPLACRGPTPAVAGDHSAGYGAPVADATRPPRRQVLVCAGERDPPGASPRQPCRRAGRPLPRTLRRPRPGGRHVLRGARPRRRPDRRVPCWSHRPGALARKTLAALDAAVPVDGTDAVTAAALRERLALGLERHELGLDPASSTTSSRRRRPSATCSTSPPPSTDERLGGGRGPARRRPRALAGYRESLDAARAAGWRARGPAGAGRRRAGPRLRRARTGSSRPSPRPRGRRPANRRPGSAARSGSRPPARRAAAAYAELAGLARGRGAGRGERA